MGFRIVDEILTAINADGSYALNRIGIRFSPNGSYNGMGSSDNPEAFTFYARKLNEKKIAYLHIMDGLGFGFHNKAPAMTLSDFRKVFDGPIIGNVGYTRDTADGAIRSGATDMVAFGRPYLANPDLVQRFRNDWPLAPILDGKLWFSHG